MSASHPVVRLREVRDADLEIFFDQGRDPAAVQMAAFTAKNPDDRTAFDRHWAKIRADAGIIMRTVLEDERVAGSVMSHSWFGDLEVTYWLGRPFWGRGLATEALKQYLQMQTQRPIYGVAAKDNLGSIRVLEKCGFRFVREGRGYANARGREIAEIVLVRDE